MANFILAESWQQYATGVNGPAGGIQTGGWSMSGPSLTEVQATSGRWGTKAVKMDSAHITKAFTAATTKGCANTAFRMSQINTGTDRPILSIMQGATNQFSLVHNTSGGLELRRGGATGTLLASSPIGTLAGVTWYFLEVMFEVDAALGKCKVYLNGALIFDLTNLNNRGAATTSCDALLLGCGGSSQRYFNDTYVVDDFVRVGERKFETVTVVSNATAQAWLVNAGAAWDAVNDTTPDNDTSYIYASIVGNRSMFNLGDLTENPVTIDLVKFNIIAAKDDAALRGLKIVASDGTNEILSPEQFLGNSYGCYSFFSPTAPDGTAWSKAKADALTVGVEVTTASA